MKTYTNPFSLENQWDGNQLGDPFIMRHDGYYYLYCSSHKAQIKCWRSEDLVEWDYTGSVCDLLEIEGAYAPEVIYTHGKFYMVTSPKGSGHYLLVSSCPTGPFELVSENFGLLIDGSLFADDDGKLYFTRAGHRGIVIHELSHDLKHEANRETNYGTSLAPKIEGTTIPESYLNYWTEGSMIIKRDGMYFMTMTGNHLHSRGYRIDYIVSDTSPTSGYITPRNKTLLLETGDEFHALGHSSTVLGPDMDSYFIAYHSFNFLAQPRYRSLNIDRLFFDGGRMYVNATWWQQNAPQLPVFVSRGGKGLHGEKGLAKMTSVGGTVDGEVSDGKAISGETSDSKASDSKTTSGKTYWMTPILIEGLGGTDVSSMDISSADTSSTDISNTNISSMAASSASICGASISVATIPNVACTFTAEFNINPRGKAVAVLLDAGEVNPRNLHISTDGINLNPSPSAINNNKPLSPNICLNSNLTIRIAQGRRHFKVWLNEMHIFEWPVHEVSITSETGLGLWSEAGETPGFVGFSHAAEGFNDYTAAKSVPGRFLAVHTDISVQNPNVVLFKQYRDFGLPAHALRVNAPPATASIKHTNTYNYRINTKKSGDYTLFLRLQADTNHAEVSVAVTSLHDGHNGQPTTGQPCTMPNLSVGQSLAMSDLTAGQTLTISNLPTGRFTTVYAGIIPLPAGESILQLTNPSGINLLDELTLVEHSKAPASLTVVENGNKATESLQILGHKQANSIIRKQWGLTCAENHGIAYIGHDSWTDYTISATINFNPLTNGTCSIFIRAIKESWFEHQASPALLGYRVKVSAEGIILSKCHYGEEILATLSPGTPTLSPGTLDEDMRAAQSVKSAHLKLANTEAKPHAVASRLTQISVTVGIVGETITITAGDHCIKYVDPNVYPHGKAGLEATGEGWGFESFTIAAYPH